MFARILARLQIVVYFLALGTLLPFVSACGKSPTAPPAPLDLTGTWSGQLAQSGSASAFRLTWVAIHRGNTAAGVATLVDPASNVQANGVMTALVDGDRLNVTFAAAPGSVPGFERCGIGGRGDAAAETHEITGTIA